MYGDDDDAVYCLPPASRLSGGDGHNVTSLGLNLKYPVTFPSQRPGYTTKFVQVSEKEQAP